jgi:cell division transport system permease protein
MLKGLFKVFFVLREGILAVVRGKGLSASIVVLVSAALLQMAVVAGVTRALDRALVSAKDRFELTVFLSAGAGEVDRTRVEDLLKGDARVASVSLLDKEQALADFRKDPDIARMLDALGENPLTDSLTVVLRPEATGRLDDLVGRLEKDPAVDEVHYGRGEWEAVSRLIRSVRIAGFVLTGLVLLAALLIVSNALALMLASRRHEWRLLSRLGAPDWAKGGPFLLEGVLHGVMGALLCVCLLEAARWLLPGAAGVAVLKTLVQLPPGEWFILYGLLAAAGATLGLLGAVLALRSPWAKAGS